MPKGISLSATTTKLLDFFSCNHAVISDVHKAVCLSNHVLHALLPPPSTASQRYNLRERTHSLHLPEHSAHLSDCNFITHLLYINTY